MSIQQTPSAKKTVLTPEGVAKMEEKLEYLKTVKRREVAARIKQAIAFGDLSENAEYDEAKNEQAFMEGEIATLENMLRTAQVIDDEDINLDMVGIGTTVRVLDMEFNEECEYTIVGSAEADPLQNKISNESPVGAGLLGHKAGETVDVEVPAGPLQMKILEIRK